MEQATCDPEACADTFSVLLVDDSPSFRMLMTQQLESMGCGVQAVPDASTFLSALMTARQPFDLVVIDFQLPDMKGDLIISWLAESELEQIRSMPVLVVTGFAHALPDDLRRGNQQLQLLSKPYRFPQLEAAVTKLLSGDTAH